MHKYEIIIYWDTEDDCFVSHAPELPGCCAHGKTSHEAVTSLEHAIEAWLHMNEEFGRPTPTPKGRRLQYA